MMKLGSREVEGLGFPRSYGQLVGELRLEGKTPDLGGVPSASSAFIIFVNYTSGHHSWASGSWRGGQGQCVASYLRDPTASSESQVLAASGELRQDSCCVKTPKFPIWR